MVHGWRKLGRKVRRVERVRWRKGLNGRVASTRVDEATYGGSGKKVRGNEDRLARWVIVRGIIWNHGPVRPGGAVQGNEEGLLRAGSRAGTMKSSKARTDGHWQETTRTRAGSALPRQSQHEPRPSPFRSRPRARPRRVHRQAPIDRLTAVTCLDSRSTRLHSSTVVLPLLSWMSLLFASRSRLGNVTSGHPMAETPPYRK